MKSKSNDFLYSGYTFEQEKRFHKAREKIAKHEKTMRANRVKYHPDMIRILEQEPVYVKSKYILPLWLETHPDFMKGAADIQQKRFVSLIISDLCKRYNQGSKFHRGGIAYVNTYSKKGGERL